MQSSRTLSSYFLLMLKGCGMGAADVVPGVSGGTIAFLVGIYEELLSSIKSFNFRAFRLLFRFQWADFWRHVNGNFLFSIVLGILISVFTLAKLMTFLLHHHPLAIWSFFFGLVLASTVQVSGTIDRWNWKTVLSFGLGTMAAYWITSATPAQTPEAYWFIFLSGALAICAMILPGISGSFILLLLGKYFFILDAVVQMKIAVLCVFTSGVVIGIIGFSHFLSWVFNRWKNITIATMAGFMLGSLNKVWPWKTTTLSFTSSDGTVNPLIEKNILPSLSDLPLAIGLALVGAGLVYGIDALAKWAKKRASVVR